MQIGGINFSVSKFNAQKNSVHKHLKATLGQQKSTSKCFAVASAADIFHWKIQICTFRKYPCMIHGCSVHWLTLCLKYTSIIDMIRGGQKRMFDILVSAGLKIQHYIFMALAVLKQAIHWGLLFPWPKKFPNEIYLFIKVSWCDDRCDTFRRGSVRAHWISWSVLESIPELSKRSQGMLSTTVSF